MKNKLLKGLTLLLTLCLICTTFAGCGEKEEVNTAVTNGAEVKLNGDKIYPIECEDTLQFWFTGVNGWEQQYENFGETPLGKEVAKKTGVKIEYVHPQQGQGNEQIQLLMASNELPDIVNHSWFQYPGGPDMAIEEDYIYALNDIFASYAPATSKILKDNPDWDKQVKTDKGNYFAFPQFNMGGILTVAYGLAVRADWMEKLNLENPKTIDEWENVLTKMKENGAAIPFGGNAGILSTAFMPAFGINPGWYRDGDTIKYGKAQPQYKDFLVKMNDWYNKGLIDHDFAVSDSKSLTKNILNGESGATMAWAGSGMGAWLEAANGEGGFDLRGVQFPVMGNDEEAEYGYVMSTVGTSNVAAISKNCKNVELAARFLDWGFTEDGHYTYNFGIEGESYNWVDKEGEKYPLLTELITNNPDGITVANMFALYTRSSHCNVPMLQHTEYITQYYVHQQQKDAQVEWAKTNMDEHLVPQIYVTEEQSSEDADIMVNVNTYIDEMTIKFITGEEPIENFDKYLEQLKTFGIDKATAFRQEAYARYQNR